MKVAAILASVFLMVAPAMAEETHSCAYVSDLSGRPGEEMQVVWSKITGNLKVRATVFEGEVYTDIITNEFVTAYRISRKTCAKTYSEIRSPAGKVVRRADQFACRDGNHITTMALYEYDYLERMGIYREFHQGQPVRGFRFKDCQIQE